MDDDTLRAIALISIIAGLVLCFFFILDYEPADAFYLSADDQNAFLQGNVTRMSYSEESGYTYMRIGSCREFDAFFEGEVPGDTKGIKVQGSYYDGALNADKIEFLD